MQTPEVGILVIIVKLDEVGVYEVGINLEQRRKLALPPPPAVQVHSHRHSGYADFRESPLQVEPGVGIYFSAHGVFPGKVSHTASAQPYLCRKQVAAHRHTQIVLHKEAQLVHRRNAAVYARTIGRTRTHGQRRVVFLSPAIVLVHLPFHSGSDALRQPVATQGELCLQLCIHVERPAVYGHVRHIVIRQVRAVVLAFLQRCGRCNVAAQAYALLLFYPAPLVGSCQVEAD